MMSEKLLMYEAATLYYDQKLTQQEIAGQMNLSRQTVSKLLNEAVRENIVEIRIHHPEANCKVLEKKLCEIFGIARCVVCSVSSEDDAMCRMMTVKTAVDYILPLVRKGGLNIAVSWGRTVQEFIRTLPEIHTKDNVVFPLFGATDNGKSYFSSNELARKLAGKLDAEVKHAWFPYMPGSVADYELLKQLSYYKKMQAMWDMADLAILGIGSKEILEIFGETFGYSEIHRQAVGDVATHFFDENGRFVNLYTNTLCASVDSIKNTKESIAIAYGKEKAAAIAGALRTKLIDTLIIDEYTAQRVLDCG